MIDIPADASELEIDEELLYITALLDSLDEHSDDYESRRQELEDDLQELGRMLAHVRNPVKHSTGTNDMQAQTRDAVDLSGGYGIKRSLDGPEMDRPIKRQTPSPLPYSAGNSIDRARKREELVKRQHALYAQIHADEAYARSISQQHAGPSMAGPAYQATLTPNGAIRQPVRPQPVGSNHVPAQSPPANVKAELKSLPHRINTETVDLTGDSEDERVQNARQIPWSTALPPYAQSTKNQMLPAVQNHYQYWGDPFQPSQQYPSMPGSYPAPNGYVYNQAPQGYASSSTATPISFGTDLYNAGRNAINSVRGMHLSHQENLQQLSNLINGSRSAPYDVDDYSEDDEDDDEIMFTGARYRHPPNLYRGREDLFRQRYQELQSFNPEKTKEELNALLKNIRPDEDLPDHLLVATPAALAIKLHKYQELGLTWLQRAEEIDDKGKGKHNGLASALDYLAMLTVLTGNRGGILADDMGLGKTIQMISLMITRKSSELRCKTNLIVAPVALLRQWKQEIQQRVRSAHALTVYIHHGPHKMKSWRDLQQYDVVLTTYGSLAQELKKLERFQLRKRNDPQARPRAEEQCALIDPDCRWYRVILDEAQCIKNKTTQTAKAACLLNAQFRFCMTGTPMMNNVTELYSLIKFLRIKPYDSYERFRVDFVTPLKSNEDNYRDTAMRKLQVLCRSVMLRRTKKSEYRGKPILVLPERSTEVDHAVFDDDEQAFYTALETRSQITFNKFLRAGTVGRSYSAILVLLLRLRQACCHPHLIKDFSIAAAADLTEDDLINLAKQLSDNVVTRIKATDGNFECSICMDATTNPAIFLPCGHDTCRECFLKLADPSNALQEGHENGSVKARCPHCRGEIDSRRITDFLSFKVVHMPELLTADEKAQFGIGQEDDFETETEPEGVDEDSETESETASLSGFIIDSGTKNEDDDSDNESEAEEASLEEELGSLQRPSVSDKHGKGKGKSQSKRKAKGKSKKGKSKVKVKKTLTLAELKKASTRNKALRKKYLRKLREDYENSAKIRKMMEILQDIIDVPELAIAEGKQPELNPPEKILIFSQWTSLLDLCEIEIDGKGYEYRRYDGSMNATARNDAVDDFKDPKKDVRIMLVSLKAGNAGLNLNCASRVIILDPFWNPYIEEQAIDRAHRIGQTRPVRVHRVLVENTVEDRIIALQESKRKIIEQALDEQQASQLARLGVAELSYLFGVTNSINGQANGRS